MLDAVAAAGRVVLRRLPVGTDAEDHELRVCGVDHAEPERFSLRERFSKKMELVCGAIFRAYAFARMAAISIPPNITNFQNIMTNTVQAMIAVIATMCLGFIVAPRTFHQRERLSRCCTLGSPFALEAAK